VRSHALNRVVMAACACCGADQACTSCTFQRIRCKQNLGVLENRPGRPVPGSRPGLLPPEAHGFVNIREQCAWPHADDPGAATAKATALLAAAMGKARLPVAPPVPLAAVVPSVLIAGKNRAARDALAEFGRQGIGATRIPELPDRVRHAGDGYAASRNDRTWQGTGILLCPETEGETDGLIAALGADPSNRTRWKRGDGIVAVRPGIFLVESAPDDRFAGPAAAARLTAWFGRGYAKRPRVPAVVDPDRCRACRTCVETCEIGAAEILESVPPSARIDPVICTGCGSCAARCPSNAIRMGAVTDDQLAAMIQGILG